MSKSILILDTPKSCFFCRFRGEKPYYKHWETCGDWGEKCELCDTCVPLTCNFEIKEVTMKQMTICGVPVGIPYESNT